LKNTGPPSGVFAPGATAGAIGAGAVVKKNI